MQRPICEVTNVTKCFGQLRAVNDLSISIENGKITGLIGPNGAGKTTLFNVIAGVLKPDKGKVFSRGRDITNLKPYQIARMGIGRTWQLIRIFPKMTVMENLEMGYFLRRDREEIAHDYNRILELFPVLGDRSKQIAGTLSGGEQQMVAVARALMSNQSF